MENAGFSFADIHSEYRPKLLRYLSRLVGPNDAEDLCQDVFVKLHAGLQDFRGEASLSTWIYRIATNAALDRLRASSAAEAAGPKSTNEILDLAADDMERSIEASLIRSEMNECIGAFVESLPESYRIVLALSHLQGFKNREIAEVLGLSLDAVKIRLHRARQELKDRLQKKCELYRTEGDELGCDQKPATGSSSG